MAKTSNRMHNRRKKLYREQNSRCCFCNRVIWLPELGMNGRPSLIGTFEHILPRSMGGTMAAYNLVLSCQVCNKFRDTMDFHTFRSVRRTGGGWEKRVRKILRARS